jgi:hypothetical protein
MCDYSLELVASRPAKVGDKLISTGFQHTVSRGFASVDDRNVAVCLLPGTELAFEDEVRCEIGFVFSRTLGHKVASFRQVNRGHPNRHRDALEFPDGKIVLLTHLCTGQKATVLQVPASGSGKVDVAERQALLVV